MESIKIGNIALFKNNIFNAIGIFCSARIKESEDILYTDKNSNKTN